MPGFLAALNRWPALFTGRSGVMVLCPRSRMVKWHLPCWQLLPVWAVQLFVVFSRMAGLLPYIFQPADILIRLVMPMQV